MVVALHMSVGASTPAIDVGDRLEVFWDDAVVDLRETTAQRVVHQPEYVGVAMRHDAPWEGDGSDFHNILVDADDKGTLYRMYYLGWAFHDQSVPAKRTIFHSGIRVCYAESRDGVTWTKPNLGLCDFNGSKTNNILFNASAFGFGWDNFMVFKDGNPTCSANVRYKAVARIEGAFGTGDAGKGAGLGCFISADGIHFRPGWLLTRAGAFDSLNLAFWDATRSEYHCYFRGFHKVAEDRNGDLNVRDIRHMTSKDFRTWTEAKRIDFQPNEKGTPADDYALYTSVVQPYPRAPHLFVGFPSRYVERKAWTPNYDRLPGVENRRYRCGKSKRHGLVVTDCVFMMSRDGASFHREDDAFMRPGAENLQRCGSSMAG